MSGPRVGYADTGTAELSKQMEQAGDGYRSRLEASNPASNRFMRRRQGEGMAAAARYNEFDLWRVREIARHMVDNDALPGAMTRRLADNVVQHTGFIPKPDTGDEALNEELLGRFNDWARDPSQVDHAGRWTWPQLQWHVFRQSVSDGEMIVLPLRSGRLQVLEADHLVSPGGVLRTTAGTGDPRDFISGGYRFVNGRPTTAYLIDTPANGPWVPSRSIQQPKEVSVTDAQGFRQVLHCYLPHRVAQWRGYSAFHPVMVESGMLDDLDFATLLKAQVSASIAGIVKSPHGRDSALGGSSSTATGPGGGVQQLERIQFGMLMRLLDDEELTSFSAPIPYDGHMKHAVHLLRKIGSGAMDLPYEMILLDGSITNFSGWKGSSDESRRAFRRTQTHFASSLHTHVWPWRVRRMLPTLGEAARRLALTGRLYRHKWVPPTWESIQRLQDAQADAVLMGENLASPRETAAARGRDYADIIRETVEDNGAAIAAAIAEAEKINANHPDAKVDWREIIRWAQPGGVTFSGQLGGDDDSTQPQPTPATERAA